MAVKKKKAKKKATVRKSVKKKIIKKKIIKNKPIKQRKPAKKSAKPVKVIKKTKEKALGIVTHYFAKVKAAVIKLKAPMAVGDTIKIKGHTTDFTETVTSLQIDRVPVESAKKGEEIGLQVNSRVRQHDVVYKAK